MKRTGNLFNGIISVENLTLAEKNARKGKANQYGVQAFDKNAEANILALNRMLENKTYTTSPYSVFLIHEPKEREIYRLPYYPDRIVHHAIMIPLEGIFTKSFTADTYSCIKGKGIHGFDKSLKRALRDTTGTQFCLKLDIKKFYPSIDHAILKTQLRRKFKDTNLLWLLDGIIDSAPGLPIGNYLSQFFANYYLTGFDHWIKEVLGVKHYFRYADDIVILGSSKLHLHELLVKIKEYFNSNLKVTVKDNYQVFPVASRGIDVVGYVYYHTHTLMRKSIKQNYARKVAKGISKASLASYKGWAKHCNSKHLQKKLFRA